MDQNINVTLETNYIEENIGTKLMDLGLREHSMNLTPKASKLKAKTNEWDYVKLKSCAQQKKLPTKQKSHQLNGR